MGGGHDEMNYLRHFLENILLDTWVDTKYPMGGGHELLTVFFRKYIG